MLAARYKKDPDTIQDLYDKEMAIKVETMKKSLSSLNKERTE